MLRLQSTSGVKSANPRTDRFTAEQTRGVQCCFTSSETVRTIRDQITTRTDTRAGRQRDKQTDRQTDRTGEGHGQTEKETEAETENDTET